MAKLIKLNTIVLVDNYIDESTLTMLSKRNINIPATIYTRQLSQQQQLDVQRHNQQYPPINIITTQRNHDRFLIIDDVVYIFGASLKDAGKKLFAYIKMQETSSAELLNHISYNGCYESSNNFLHNHHFLVLYHTKQNTSNEAIAIRATYIGFPSFCPASQ